jgi:ribonuclease III
MGLPDFKNPSLLVRGLTHSSYVNEHADAGEDNERLEFLGDAVLDFIAGSFLYHNYPNEREGGLTRLRSALVWEPQLAAFAAELGIGPMLRLGRGEEETGGRQRQSLLADAFEAVIGAYFLDSGLEAVRQFIEPLLERAAEEIYLSARSIDAKSLFQEWAQSRLNETPRYFVISVSGPDHQREYTVEVRVSGEIYGTGAGPSKQAATQAAAQAALVRVGLA